MKAIVSARLLSKKDPPIQELQYFMHKGYLHKGQLASDN